MKYLFCIAALAALAGLSIRAAENNDEKFTSSTWVSGTGARAQIWMLKVRGNAITGAICGPCDDPRTLAPIMDGRVIDAHHISIFIVHDLQGPAIPQYGPYRNEARITITGDTAEMTSHLAGASWETRPAHATWKLLSKSSSADTK